MSGTFAPIGGPRSSAEAVREKPPIKTRARANAQAIGRMVGNRIFIITSYTACQMVLYHAVHNFSNLVLSATRTAGRTFLFGEGWERIRRWLSPMPRSNAGCS